MSYGKVIEIFLVNGTADSLTTAELSNWNGKAVKIPRSEVAKCCLKEINEIGVYFLICKEDDGKDSVYIGEAENIQERLKQHINDNKSGKETYYWNTAVFFVGRDLNKALIRYLENRFVDITKSCGKYKVLTKTTYANTVIKDSQKAVMEEFIDNVKILFNALGYRILVPAPQADTDTEYLYCQGSGGSATGFVSSGGFTVLKDSTVSSNVAPSLEVHGKGYFNLRSALENDGTIAEGAFTRDYEFSSPSAAATIVTGHMANGNTDWKKSDGTKLKDL